MFLFFVIAASIIFGAICSWLGRDIYDAHRAYAAYNEYMNTRLGTDPHTKWEL